jgi:hypothetical protein
MKRLFFILQLLLLLTACKDIFWKDDQLSFVQTPNTTEKIRLDGYYYWRQYEPERVGVNVFYQNGIAFSFGLSDSTEIFENELLMGNLTFNAKLHWGLYYIKEDTLFKNGFAVSSGGFYYIENFSKYLILNDTTIIWKERFSSANKFYYNDTLHFKQFGIKPDSSYVFIK